METNVSIETFEKRGIVSQEDEGKIRPYLPRVGLETDCDIPYQSSRQSIGLILKTVEIRKRRVEFLRLICAASAEVAETDLHDYIQSKLTCQSLPNTS